MEDNNQEIDAVFQKRDDHVPHEFPAFDPDYCSCCRKAIIHGLHNVGRIQSMPEFILDMNGNRIGVDKRKPAYKAVMHASCWKIHFGKRLECEKCGGFSDALKLADGTKNQCGCSCHRGAPNCSYIVNPHYIQER